MRFFFSVPLLAIDSRSKSVEWMREKKWKASHRIQTVSCFWYYFFVAIAFSIFCSKSQRNRSVCIQCWIGMYHVRRAMCLPRIGWTIAVRIYFAVVLFVFSFFSCCDRSHSLWSSIQFTFCQRFFFYSRPNERFVYASRIIYWLLMSNGYLFIVCLMNYSRCLLCASARAPHALLLSWDSSSRCCHLRRFFFVQPLLLQRISILRGNDGCTKWMRQLANSENETTAADE